MTTPLVQQGTLNRLRASVVFTDNSALNVTAPYLAKEAINMTPEGPVGRLEPTMTGGVTSPEPYQMMIVTMHILRSQSLSALYKQQIETSANVGDISIIPDASTLPNYNLSNCIIENVDAMTFDGTQPGFTVRIRGIYYINAALYAGG
jgi:hypothetical protein